MLDFSPPPAIYEEAPDWVRTQSGLLIPQKRVKEAVLPGLTPFPMLGGDFGLAQMPPTPRPSGSLAAINSAGLGTANPANSSTASFAYSPSAHGLVWAAFRTNVLNDTGTWTPTITDNNGGTYSPVGSQIKVSYNNSGTLSTFWAQLFVRDQITPPTGLSGTVVTMSSAWTGASTSVFNAAYVLELANPNLLPFHIVQRTTNVGTGATLPLTNTGDLFCLDCFCGSGAVAGESANSGFTSIAGANTFVSSQVRLQIYGSYLNAQSPTRTLAQNATLGGAAASYAVWLDVKKSAPKLNFSLTELNKQNTFANSATYTVNIGYPAPDRQVVVYVGGAANASSAVTYQTCSAPGVTFEQWLGPASGNSSASIFGALVPTGNTLTLTVTGTGAPYHVCNVFAVYGANRLGNNQIGSLTAGVGETSPGANWAANNTANAPFSWVGTRFIPKGAVALGGGGSRGSVTAILTTGSHAWTSAGAGHGYAMPAYNYNNTAADWTDASAGISYSGTIAVHLALVAFGP